MHASSDQIFLTSFSLTEKVQSLVLSLDWKNNQQGLAWGSKAVFRLIRAYEVTDFCALEVSNTILNLIGSQCKTPLQNTGFALKLTLEIDFWLRQVQRELHSSR